MDPVLEFIMSRETYDTVRKNLDGAPYSRLSGSRMSRLGYDLICLRYRQLGVPEPTRKAAQEMYSEFLEKSRATTV
jgi:hypothetical protein